MNNYPDMIRPEFIVMTTVFGGRDISYLHEAIPNLRECVDYQHDAMANFLNSMNMTENPCVHLEDDVELCNDFVRKVIDAINQHPDTIINFFSLRKGDYEIGKPRFVAGREYIGNVCFYIPAGMGPQIAEYYKIWKRKHEHPTGYDLMMADWMKERKMQYIAWFPHLVNHLPNKSLINPRRPIRTDKKFQR